MNKSATEVNYQLPAPFPPSCASAWGEDGCGLWFSLNHQGVEQKFRWIWPGRFLMGSPSDEPERWSGERHHGVIISQGYWLADTTCSQALWKVVMGKNPAYFKGDRLPVEQVSWVEVEKFIACLNEARSDLALRLPREAEWEWACRAGTTTPFSFGAKITSEQVNYDCNYPYGAGEKGGYRKKTVAVGSLPANPWGLYEMHGNVLEWCADWFDDYPAGPVVDPWGPDRGEYRVLRGGGWNYYGRDVRSATRIRSQPSRRNGGVGFRLARSQ